VIWKFVGMEGGGGDAVELDRLAGVEGDQGAGAFSPDHPSARVACVTKQSSRLECPEKFDWSAAYDA
jgi:hypothetical protein